MSDYSAVGIFQSDLIIYTAILEGIDRLRQEPWLINYCFSSLSNDPIAEKFGFGSKIVAHIREWFLNNNINVTIGSMPQSPDLPSITIALSGSTETENTLADINYEPQIDLEGWKDLTEKFNAVHYAPTTGILTLPDSIVNTLLLSTEYFVVLNNGNYYQVEEVLGSQIRIPKNLNVSFNQIVIRTANPSQAALIENTFNKETYVLGCFVQGQENYTIYLHAILKFILLMYKQELLEARGFERTSITSGGVEYYPDTGAELTYNRLITLVGYTRNDWPKKVGYKNAVTAVIVDGQDPDDEDFDLNNFETLLVIKS